MDFMYLPRPSLRFMTHRHTRALARVFILEWISCRPVLHVHFPLLCHLWQDLSSLRTIKSEQPPSHLLHGFGDYEDGDVTDVFLVMQAILQLWLQTRDPQTLLTALEGEFAFVLVDEEKELLLAARDPLGVK